jgi:hypothetical protein
MTVQLIRYTKDSDKPEIINSNPSEGEVRAWLNPTQPIPEGEMRGILSDGLENTYTWGE